MTDQHDHHDHHDQHDKTSWRKGCPLIILEWIEGQLHGTDFWPDVIRGVPVPDAEYWRDRLRAEIAYRIADVVGADAAYSDLMGVAHATDAQVRSNVELAFRKEAGKAVSEANGEANGLAAARAPLAKGTAERQDTADLRRKFIKRALTKLGIDPKSAPTHEVEAALIASGKVTKTGSVYTIHLNDEDQPTVSRSTFKDDLKRLKDGTA